jgi:hypothetical protein
MKKFLKIAIALLCFCFLQCHSLAEALKEISNQTGGQQEEPQPSEDDNTDTGRQRKSAD